MKKYFDQYGMWSGLISTLLAFVLLLFTIPTSGDAGSFLFFIAIVYTSCSALVTIITATAEKVTTKKGLFWIIFFIPLTPLIFAGFVGLGIYNLFFKGIPYIYKWYKNLE
jgi:ABC-type Na+ efflux pump permease subunit